MKVKENTTNMRVWAKRKTLQLAMKVVIKWIIYDFKVLYFGSKNRGRLGTAAISMNETENT